MKTVFKSEHKGFL